MKEFVCTVCGYVHKIEGDLPDDFTCPLCGAGKDAFVLKEDGTSNETINVKKSHIEKELSAIEMSIICSNLACGCENSTYRRKRRTLRHHDKFYYCSNSCFDYRKHNILSYKSKKTR